MERAGGSRTMFLPARVGWARTLRRVKLSRLLLELAQAVLRGAQQEARGARHNPHPAPKTGRRSAPGPVKRPGSQPSAAYPGDFRGRLEASYSPTADGRPDPGEVCWAWIPFEDDHSRGKDRPVLVVGQSGPWLLALPMTSKDHDRDAGQEARAGRHWMDLGPGPWDASGRPSEVRLDRVVRLSPATVRREGSVVDRALFDKVIEAAAALR